MRSKLKALGLITTAFILAFSLFLPQAEAGYQGSSLEDEIQEMIDKGIMQGYPDGTFRHTDSITRAEFTLILDRLLELPDADETAPFSDLPGRQETVDAISSANEAGIIRGYDDNTFRPDEKIQRQQIAAMIERALEYEELGDLDGTITVPDFPDKSEISPRFTDEVDYIASLGIIRGYGDLTFRPQQSAERGHAAAFMSRMLEVMDTGEGIPDSDEPVKDEGTFQVATVNSEGDISTRSGSYNTFSAAMDQKESSSDLVLNDGEVVHMSSGIVRPKDRRGSTDNVYGNYSNLRFSNAITYVSSDHRFPSEMNYKDSDDVHVKVSIAGRTGYVRADDFELIPDGTKNASERNHYVKNENGHLMHRLYNQTGETYTPYTFGKAPDFMETGQRYYSEDGATFYTSPDAEEPVGKAYQYFNRMPVKSESSYSAEDLDYFIDNNTVSSSKLRDLGEDLKEAEDTYGVNALYILGAAIHESGYGTSDIAMDHNNLFGRNATDGDPYGNADRYDSPRDSVMSFASTHMLQDYMNHDDWRFEGSIPGNKGIGFNIRYASDMYWGHKIAGHMYRVDNYLGKKDIGKYNLAETTAQVNVRTSADSTVSSNILFQYKKANMPVIIFDEETADNGATWYQVSADHPDHSKAYIHSNYVETIPYVE